MNKFEIFKDISPTKFLFAKFLYNFSNNGDIFKVKVFKVFSY